jgi:hypothetical protein
MAARIPKALLGRERALAERDADPVLVAPHGSAGQMYSSCEDTSLKCCCNLGRTPQRSRFTRGYRARRPCLKWVKPGKAQCEHKVSAVHPTTDMRRLAATLAGGLRITPAPAGP